MKTVIDVLEGECGDSVIVTLAAGTVVKINGIPLALEKDTTVITNKGNVPLIEEPFRPNHSQ